MSEERLEEIVKQVKRSDEYAEKGLWAVSDKKIVNHTNKGLAEKMFYIENSKRKITEALEDDKQERSNGST